MHHPRQDNTYHGLCYTSRGVLAGTRNSSMGPPHEGSIQRPIAPWAKTRNHLIKLHDTLCYASKWDKALLLNICLWFNGLSHDLPRVKLMLLITASGSWWLTAQGEKICKSMYQTCTVFNIHSVNNTEIRFTKLVLTVTDSMISSYS